MRKRILFSAAEADTVDTFLEWAEAMGLEADYDLAEFPTGDHDCFSLELEGDPHTIQALISMKAAWSSRSCEWSILSVMCAPEDYTRLRAYAEKLGLYAVDEQTITSAEPPREAVAKVGSIFGPNETVDMVYHYQECLFKLRDRADALPSIRPTGDPWSFDFGTMPEA